MIECASVRAPLRVGAGPLNRGTADTVSRPRETSSRTQQCMPADWPAGKHATESFEESQIHPSTHSFHKYLLNADHVAGTVPGTVDIVA